MQKMTVMALPKSVIERMENRAVTEKPPKLTEKLAFYSISKYREYLFLHALAFLLGRLTLLGDLAPFGMGFFAAVAQVSKERAFGVGIAALLGVLSSGKYEEAGVYLFTILVYFKLRGRLARADKTFLAVPACMFFSLGAGGLAVNFMQGAAPYDNLVVLFNAVLCMTSARLFTYGAPLLLDRSRFVDAYEKPANESMICLIVILSLAIAGIGDARLFDFRIQNIFCSMLVMILSLAGGAGLGAAVGVVIGTVVGLHNGGDALGAIALYAVGGMIAGVFQPLGKSAVVLGFIFGSVIVHLGFTPLPFLLESIAEALFASVILMLTPLSNIMRLKKSLTRRAPAQPLYVLAENGHKLQSVADMFYDLGNLLDVHSEERPEEKEQENLSKLFSAVGNQVCESCLNRPVCWEENYYRTYQHLLSIFNQLDSRPLQGKQLPLEFREECINAGKMVDVVNQVLEKDKICAYWRNKIKDQTQMVSEQMKAAGNIIAGLAQEIEKPRLYDGKLANILREKARKIGCEIDNVRISGGKQARQIEFEKAPCPKAGECVTSIMPLVVSTLQERFTLVKKCGDKESGARCKICMKAALRYQMKSAVASAAKGGKRICGDSVKITPLSLGKVSLMLSDGMGSGRSAARESRLTVNYLSKLLEQNFDVDIAVKTVNSLLLAQSKGDKFATVDMAIVDRYTGEAEFLKIASAPSFIKRVREVKTIQAKSLPVGILSQIEIEPIKMQLAVNDMLVMVSDGIADLKHIKFRCDDKEGWLVNFLRRSTIEDEQKFADAILQEAIRISGGEAKDDMTVLVTTLGEAGLI